MQEQMNMAFMQEGGMQDDGGETEPKSGNKVPSGSLKEEVADDIPTMLSEGEFVFPADVVRYIGLETLMKMRQDAKQGLKMMEKMGQLGNPEEAEIPDDVPFGMADLVVISGEMKKEDDDKEEKAEGGAIGLQAGGLLDDPRFTSQVTAGTQPTEYTEEEKQEIKEALEAVPTRGKVTLKKIVNPNNPDDFEMHPFEGDEPMFPIPEGYVVDESASEPNYYTPRRSAVSQVETRSDTPAPSTTTEQDYQDIVQRQEAEADRVYGTGPEVYDPRTGLTHTIKSGETREQTLSKARGELNRKPDPYTASADDAIKALETSIDSVVPSLVLVGSSMVPGVGPLVASATLNDTAQKIDVVKQILAKNPQNTKAKELLERVDKTFMGKIAQNDMVTKLREKLTNVEGVKKEWTGDKVKKTIPAKAAKPKFVEPIYDAFEAVTKDREFDPKQFGLDKDEFERLTYKASFLNKGSPQQRAEARSAKKLLDTYKASAEKPLSKFQLPEKPARMATRAMLGTKTQQEIYDSPVNVGLRQQEREFAAEQSLVNAFGGGAGSSGAERDAAQQKAKGYAQHFESLGKAQGISGAEYAQQNFGHHFFEKGGLAPESMYVGGVPTKPMKPQRLKKGGIASPKAKPKKMKKGGLASSRKK